MGSLQSYPFFPQRFAYFFFLFNLQDLGQQSPPSQSHAATLFFLSHFPSPSFFPFALHFRGGSGVNGIGVGWPERVELVVGSVIGGSTVGDEVSGKWVGKWLGEEETNCTVGISLGNSVGISVRCVGIILGEVVGVDVIFGDDSTTSQLT